MNQSIEGRVRLPSEFHLDFLCIPSNLDSICHPYLRKTYKESLCTVNDAREKQQGK